MQNIYFDFVFLRKMFFLNLRVSLNSWQAPDHIENFFFQRENSGLKNDGKANELEAVGIKTIGKKIRILKVL